MDKNIEQALEVLRRGGIILYPTDTVWGIGCDATNVDAVQRIYDLKRSSDKKSMLVLCKDANMVVKASDDENSQQKVETGDILLYVGIGVIALAAIGGAALLITKKKKSAGAESK